MKNLIIILFFPLICLGQSQTQIDAFKGTATGTNNYTISISSVTSPTIYDGQKILVKFTNSNSAASTLKVNSYSAKDIEDQEGNALVSGAIPAGCQLLLSYNSTFDSWQVIGGTSGGGGSGTVTSVGFSAGTGISLGGTNPITGTGTVTITNSSPDQTVTIANGTGIVVGGTYPTFTVTNSSPDVPISLTAGTGFGITGSYPSYTLTNTSPNQTVTITEGSGIDVTGTYPNFTITNTDTSKWNISGSDIYNQNTGNVGIGNSSPDAKIDVVSTSTVNPVASFSVNTSGSANATGVNINAEGGTTTDALVVNSKSNVSGGINNSIVALATTANGGYNNALTSIAQNGDYNYGAKVIAQGGVDAVGLSISASGASGNNNAIDITAGNFKYTPGSEGAGKVLTSDANGVASWQTAAAGGGVTTAVAPLSITTNTISIQTPTSGTVLRANGTAWTNSTYSVSNTFTANSILHATSTNTVGENTSFGFNGNQMYMGTTTPSTDHGVDFRWNNNAATYWRFYNPSTGTSSRNILRLYNQSYVLDFGINGINYTNSGLLRASTPFILFNAPTNENGLIYTSSTNGLIFAIGGTSSSNAKMYLDGTNGFVGIGTGTVAATAPLHVTGSTRALQISSTATTVATRPLMVINSAGDTILQLNSRGMFQTGNLEENLYFGYNSGLRTTTGTYNTSHGKYNLAFVTSGSYNTAGGHGSLYKLTTGNRNTAWGFNTLYNDTTGDYNTVIGGEGQNQNVSGSYNTSAGFASLFYNKIGSSNTAIGMNSLFNNKGSGNLGIGYFAGYYGTWNNKGFIDNQDRTDSATQIRKSFMVMDFGADSSVQQLRLNGRIQITGGNYGAGKVLTSDANGLASWTTPSSGSVTSVAQSFTGGLISVAGSPITSSGTLALTVAGTSGGIPYFSSSSTWASSSALTANALMIGGGAGVAPSTTTTGTGVLTALGVNTGSAGAFVVNGGALGTPSSGTATNLTGLPLTTGVTGILPTANGGTNSSLTATSGSLLVGNGTAWVPTSKVTIDDANSSILLKAASGTNTDLLFKNRNTTNNFAIGTFYPSSGTNVGSYFEVCPKGSGNGGVATQFTFGLTDYIADVTNYSAMIQRTGSSGISWTQVKGGTGSYYPFFFNADGTYTPSTSTFYIGTNKKVGINTDTPQSKLDVEGNVAIGATYSGTTAAPTNGLIVEGLVGMGVSSPTAVLHLKAGSTSANTAPLKFTSGTNMTTPENGAVEYNGTDYFVTSGSTRYTLMKALNGSATLDFPSTSPNTYSDLTITVTGASTGDVVSLGAGASPGVANTSFFAWVSASNTVTVRFNNADASLTADPGSATFKVSVFK